MEKIFEQIPDVWFDLYARLIPGFFCVITAGFLFFDIQPTNQLLLIFVLSYVVGHIAQPIASLVARVLEYQIFDRNGNIKKCRKYFDAGSRESKLLSKQHAECACFASLSILTVIIFAATKIKSMSSVCSVCSDTSEYILWGLLLYFIICTFLRAHAVADRAKTYQERISTEQQSNKSSQQDACKVGASA